MTVKELKDILCDCDDSFQIILNYEYYDDGGEGYNGNYVQEGETVQCITKHPMKKEIHISTYDEGENEEENGTVIKLFDLWEQQMDALKQKF